MPLIITKHAMMRIKQRVGGRKKEIETMAKAALTKKGGQSIQQLDGYLKKWAINKKRAKSDILKIRGKYLFVYTRNIMTKTIYLVTVLEIPGAIENDMDNKNKNNQVQYMQGENENPNGERAD